MSEFAGTNGSIDVAGTLCWNDFEGGFWSLDPDSGDPALVLQGWAPQPPLAAGTHVRARVRVREEQLGFLMAGTYVDVESIEPA